MARTPEQADKDLTATMNEVERLSGELESLKKSVGAVNALVTHTGGNEALPPNHVLSPSRRGLGEYEEAKSKLVRQKPGELVDLVHLGKKISVDYAQGRELLAQAQVR